MASSNDKSNKSDQDSKSTAGGYNTPIDETQRHTGMYEEGDGKQSAQPEGGSSKAGPEGAPNQGLEKR